MKEIKKMFLLIWNLLIGMACIYLFYVFGMHIAYAIAFGLILIQLGEMQGDYLNKNLRRN